MSVDNSLNLRKYAMDKRQTGTVFEPTMRLRYVEREVAPRNGSELPSLRLQLQQWWKCAISGKGQWQDIEIEVE